MADLGSTSYSETDASNNASPPNGWPEGMNPSDVNNSARANMGAEKRWWDRSNSTLTTGGTSTAYTLTYAVAAAAYYDGEEFSFIVNATTGAAPTLNINGLGARQIRKFSAGAFTNIAAGDIVANQPIVVRYNLAATTFDIVSGGGALPTLSPTTTLGDLIVRGASVDGRLALGTTGQVLRSNGTTAVYGDPITVKKQAITSTGTYTPSTGMLYCIIECVGGGGGGGGAQGNSGVGTGGGGGGAGSYSRLLATAATIGASKAVTIGAAGAAGAAGNNAGGAGGDTSVGSLCIGKGGAGGAGMPNTGALGYAAGGLGGVAGTGDIAGTGAPGQGGPLAVGTVVLPSGSGGSGPFGGGGRGIATTAAFNSSGSATGEAASGFGAGGSGGMTYNIAANSAGGIGTAGYVFITEFCNQ